MTTQNEMLWMKYLLTVHECLCVLRYRGPVGFNCGRAQMRGNILYAFFSWFFIEANWTSNCRKFKYMESFRKIMIKKIVDNLKRNLLQLIWLVNASKSYFDWVQQSWSCTWTKSSSFKLRPTLLEETCRRRRSWIPRKESNSNFKNVCHSMRISPPPMQSLHTNRNFQNSKM